MILSRIPAGPQLINVCLRLATLVTKVGLMLYMSRYLSLADMGTYGLVFGAVMIASDIIGVRFDYVVSRDIVGATPETALCKMRDQVVFYGLNHLTLFVLGITALELFNGSLSLDKHFFYIIALAIVESYATAVHANVVSLGRPLIANVLFFIRAALWVLVAVALGFADESLRIVDAIFVCWFLGVVASLGGALYLWRHMPWHILREIPIDWIGIRSGLKKTWPIWLGTIGATFGAYVDRFIVERYLSLDCVGVLTFYFSFAAAIQTLILSGVLSFAYPKLISLHRDQDENGFWIEIRKMWRSVVLWASCLVMGMAVGVPLLGWISQKPRLIEEIPTLLLLLIGAWIRASSDALYYALFARHQDRPVWLGNLLFLVVAFACNAFLVPRIGFSGIGWGSILANLFLFFWRWKYVAYPGGWQHLLTGKQ